MKKLVKLVLTLIVAYPLTGIAVSSCSGESDCSTAGRPMLRGTIHRIEEGVVLNDTLDSLTITAIYTDSTILNNQKNVTEISLPLRFTSDTTILVLRYSRVTYDTILIKHSNTPNFVSMDCGYEMKQAILELKHSRHRLDSIHVTSKSTNTDGTRNLQLFYR